ncbi:MAG: glutamine--fructose-6-phosphate transaminase (isomerizing) [Candidatus Eremiobacteraeota bacterium]|nr:glutamine--fructose-6-phosphate transaminase (isomerizing) [Candidatus Eremiobacteraeota bacterium]
MCGIVGYIGGRSAVPILMSGLKRLEYRGYDSAGVSVLKNGDIEQLKAKGKLSILSSILKDKPLRSRIGIGHTRWATHGAPSDENSHPHMDCKKEISLVHNGIIENYLTLRQELEEKGHKFLSETDTEVLVHLIEEYYEGNLEQAVSKALKRLEGSYAIGVICKKEPGKIVAARQDSPLVIGLGKNENFIASDIPAFLPFTRKVKHINDGEIVILKRNSVRIFDLDLNPVEREVTTVHWDASMAEKGGYKHFMLKEIFEQPRVVTDMLSGRLKEYSVEIEEMKLTDDDLRKINKVIIIACGTAFHASMVGKYFIEDFARIPVEIDVASEFRYRNPVVDENSLVVAVSQSGETADTLVSFKNAIAMGAKSIAVTNMVGSSITRETENMIFTRAGLEIGVAATKTFIAQLVAIFLLSLKLGVARGTIDKEKFREYHEALLRIPDQLSDVLKKAEQIRNIARKYYKCDDFLFLGRSLSYPIALEGALKLKEISYIHAEGYAAGEMKHGPIALIDNLVPTVVVLPRDSVYEKTLSNVKEVRARSGITIGITNKTDDPLDEYLDETIFVPDTSHQLSPILTTIPLQLLAYYIADKRNRDVDQPRNLAKSVTVE